MAFFKFRKGVDEPAPPPPMAESVEDLRKRARHRLIGAAVLVVLGIVGFPMLFDSQPRPIAIDIPIEIPDKNAQKPELGASTAKSASPMIVETEAPAKPVAPAPVALARPAAASAAVAAPVAAAPVLSPQVAPAPPLPKPSVAPVITPKAQPSPEPKPVAKPVDKPLDKPVEKKPLPVDDGAKARALLDGKATEASNANAAGGRFVIQIGAFSDANKAQDVRTKLERAGLKTYTQVVQTKEGARTRVRVGPVATRLEADKLAERIHKLDLPAAILTL